MTCDACGALVMYVVYDTTTSDFPGWYVCRRWEFHADGSGGTDPHKPPDMRAKTRCTVFQIFDDAAGLWQPDWEACGKYKR